MMDNKIQTNTVAACKQDNHVILYQAICEIDNVIGHANELLARIIGQDMAKPEEGIGTQVHLVEVLQRGPDMIMEKNAQIHNILNEISEHLF